MDRLGTTLLALARRAIDTSFNTNRQAHEIAPEALNLPRLSKPGATFVTLALNGKLRGCMGSVEASRPLKDDVVEHALAAAFRDPRFAPLTFQEWKQAKVEVSLLDEPQHIRFVNEEEILGALLPGRDGVILEHGSLRATFLPQVWETLPEPRQFIQQLKIKAGLSANFWDNRIKLARYRVQKWKEM